jgi:hypothetical protein
MPPAPNFFVPANAETRLRELALSNRLAHPFPVVGMPTLEPPRLWVGAIPDDLHIDVPLPDGAGLIGSARSRNRFDGTHVFAESALSPDEAWAFYQQHFAARGLSVRAFPTPVAIPTSTQYAEGDVCQETELASLTIRASRTASEAATLLWLIYVDEPRAVVCNAAYMGGLTTYAQASLPKLGPAWGPPRGGRGGSFDGWAYTQIDFKSDESVETLVGECAVQLQEQGWSPHEENTPADPLKPSQWVKVDERQIRWLGTLIVRAERDRRFVAFQMRPDDAP